jgi:hypothetical protein
MLEAFESLPRFLDSFHSRPRTTDEELLRFPWETAQLACSSLRGFTDSSPSDQSVQTRYPARDSNPDLGLLLRAYQLFGT